MSPTQTTTDSIGDDTRLALFQHMVRVRRFEETAYRLFLTGLVKGTTHLSIGQEAIAAGFASAMRSDDYTFCTYRGHSHVLTRGTPMAGVMGELLGRSTGVCRGKGGSMHLTSVEHGVMGSYAIVGAHLVIANGAAWSAKLRGSGQVTVCFFGDGATNIGAFHEALNFAKVWELPVVFVCENNQYMEYTPIREATAVENPAADRASAYGLESVLIDGNDPDAVFVAAKDSIEKARSGGGPSLIEAETYRHGGHSRGDPGDGYRSEEEIAAWMERDPLVTYRARLLDEGFDEARLQAMDDEAQEEVGKATEDAKAAPLPSPSDAFTNLWANGGSSWRN